MHTNYHYLRTEAALLRNAAEKLRGDCWEVPLTASLSGMPFGGQTSDSTARVALSGEAEEKQRKAATLDRRADRMEAIHTDISARLRTLTGPERRILCAVDLCGRPAPLWHLRTRLSPNRSIRWWTYTLARARSRMKS